MNRTRTKKGFGILEVLLAGVIIVIVLGALVFLARNSLNNSIYLQEKGQATFLAQEGLEIVRHIRDTNYIDEKNDTKWNSFIIDGGGGPGIPSGNPTIDYSIGFDSTSNEYEIKNGIDPIIAIDDIEFTRTISFSSLAGEELLDNDEDLQENAIVAIVRVTWNSSFKSGEVEIRELITNSRQGF